MRIKGKHALVTRPIILVTITLLLQGAVGSQTGAAPGAAQDPSGQGTPRRDDPCNQLPDPPGEGKGIREKCPELGSSSGIAKGDFNDDNIGDLAIGVPGEDVTVTISGTTRTFADAGVVHIIYGTAATGLTAVPDNAPENQLLTQSKDTFQASNNFGGTLAAGDFNNDGFSDLAVGIPGQRTTTPAKGAVEVFYGSATGLQTSGAQFFGPRTFTPLLNPGNSAGATSLTWGDFNNDQLGDLAVASSYTADFVTQTGAVTVLFGSSTVRNGLGGLTTVGKRLLPIEQIALDQNHQSAPLVLSAGDFDDDQFSDLVAGSPLHDSVLGSLAGAVHVLYGGDNLALDTSDLWQQGSDGVPAGGIGSAEEFGTAVAVGNFNGDDFADLAVGGPGDATGDVAAGSVVTIYGSAFGLQPVQVEAPSQIFTQADMGGSNAAENDDRFGAALAAGDFDGDGRQDLAIGVPGEDVIFSVTTQCGTRTCTVTYDVENAGLVHAIYGSQSGLSTSVRAPQTFNQASLSALGDIVQIIEPGDQFGSLLTAWNFGRTAQADLAVGVPSEDLSTLIDAGVVHAVYGSATGLAPATFQVWSQNTAGIKDSAESGDRFGQSIY